MKLQFTKMQGLGNDFMVIDGVNQQIKLSTDTIRRLGDRHFGIGFDQLLLVEPSTRADIDFSYRIFNNDGSEVEQCGNGARCFARFVHDKKLSLKKEIAVETARGVIYPRLEDNGHVSVNMGVPQFSPKEIPFIADSDLIIHPLDIDGIIFEISVVSMGNPHAVQVVTDVEVAPVASIGPKIETHPQFPAKVNVGFMQIISRDEIKLRVFERAAGETLACGTGACAAVVAGIRRGLLNPQVRVLTHGGELTIAWEGDSQAVWMTGPAVTVFDGTINLQGEEYAA
ncbi:diaminopimelate epimerase [Janthinobacterium sp. B9-8]|uniref:diaminopimelate epimerase n=1 Tax=Janthinobacterium sp. B9-8 TaxID=1236179 RepID=UPI00061D12CB|nr:diaminopimelate epimerase [Janthinobacterium sp. B9-8]AMC35943.1 diaminopimelate epimerase [Janthinobacterium sp. B9-8]